MRALNIAVLPGDGIGPEVTKEAIKVLQALADIDSTFTYETKEFHWNSDYYLKTGQMMPEDGLEQLKTFDSILFGAIGDNRVPDQISVWDLIMPIRKNFQQYVNFRPIKLLKGLEGPLKNNASIDFVIIRENGEGEYSNVGGMMFQGENREMSVQNTIMTRQGVTQIAEFAYKYVRDHSLDKVTNATKSNAIIHSMKFWDQVVEETAKKHSDISYERYYIDALAAYFVQRPEDFQVVLASNLFGDILSDLGSAIVGGLGLAPSGNINPSHEYPSMFEAVHGSAPDIAGRGIANPIAQIWSAALLLEHIGRKDLHDNILAAIEALLVERKILTPDLGGTATTVEVGDAIVEKLYK
ncbi:tartrate dehydrogenase/decarboxylase/D-malate dehydrogenase [Virgibacillus natechei]|uniref:D-malate dehydrogenase (decarboxylating) n=1 Tax=Virgibacillus natechei TaxID=1216297 RepID=A0ABS4IHX0_9BACI|nr:tartrate dehydrogenase [Virgibacillus natechei]MBP1970046.1 tartrate dehydrogenase/decarboxylase/D-malate dehydrogenase [Virgibacillus natechei]UZD14131.1 tartrate dehydrogenase [Virgibacillus natechei]